MRLSVTTAALACASALMTQTTPAQAPTPTTASRPPAQGQRFRRATPPGTAAANAKLANAAPDTPMFTVHGVCKDKQAKAPCDTVITREDLDRFISAVDPNATGAARSRLAVQYARTLAFSALAEQQGLDKNPVLAKELDAELRIARMRILGTAYWQKLQAQSPIVADAEIQKYYTEHQDQFVRAQVRRLAVPVSVPTSDGHPLNREAVLAELAALRARAVAGEDLNELQQAAFKDLNIQAAPPPVNPLTLRPRDVQGDEARVFDLHPGEITAVIDSAAAWVFLKLDSKDTVAVESVHQEVEAAVRRDRLLQALSEVGKRIATNFNLEYFDMPSQPDVFGPGAITPVVTRPTVRRSAIGQ